MARLFVAPNPCSIKTCQSNSSIKMPDYRSSPPQSEQELVRVLNCMLGLKQRARTRFMGEGQTKKEESPGIMETCCLKTPSPDLRCFYTKAMRSSSITIDHDRSVRISNLACLLISTWGRFRRRFAGPGSFQLASCIVRMTQHPVDNASHDVSWSLEP